MKPFTSLTIFFCLMAVGCNHPSLMSDEELVRAAFDVAEGKLSAVDDDATQLPEPYKTIGLVYSAQGIIDNGGLKYFFESDWPHTPPYSEFADAYERIGSAEAAEAIRAAAASFKLQSPEKNRDGRRAYMNANFDREKFNVRGWDDTICGDKRVFKNLAAWARRQPNLNLR